MRKLTSDEIAGEIYEILRKKSGWLVQTSCSGENAHLQITAEDGTSFIVYIAPIVSEPSDAEDRAADALWNKIKKRISEELK